MKYTFFILFNFYSFALLCQSEVRVDLKKLITDYEGFESYNKNDFPLGDFSETRFKKEYEFFNEIHNKLSSISLKDLSENDKISYGLLMFIINDKINSYEFNSRYNPILSDSGFHNSIIYNVRALTGEKDAIRYLELLKAIPLYVEQNIYLIQKGINIGVSQPKIIFKGFHTTYDKHITENYKNNYYYTPFQELPDNIKKSLKDSIILEAQKIIMGFPLNNMNQFHQRETS